MTMDIGIPMARKRISSRKAGDIASKRMSILFSLSEDAVRDGNEDRARRYVHIAKRIGQKTNTPITERYCKGCGLPMIQGINCRTRIGDGRVKVTCLSCGKVRRMPYIREQRT